MTPQIIKRKKIILSLKSNYGDLKKGIEKRIQFLEVINILSILLTLISAGLIVLSILFELFDYKMFVWKKMGLLAILSLSFILKLPKDLYELKLLKHLKKISSKSELDKIDNLNDELKKIINSLNGLKNWIVILLAILILIMGIWQMGFNNNANSYYWNFVKIPILFFYGIVILNAISTYKKLTKNIIETEKHIANKTTI